MPTAEQYKEGFNLYAGLTIDNFIIINDNDINIKESQIQRWNKYSYPTIIKFTHKSPNIPSREEVNIFLQHFSNYVDGIKIIHSNSGRPFKCTFHNNDHGKMYAEIQNNSIIIKCNGYAERVSNAVALKYNK
jgi:hypothetical protein